MKLSGYLPIFTGFYESAWDVNDLEFVAECDWKEEDGLTDEQVEKRCESVEWSKYYAKLSKIICEEIGDKLIKYVPGISKVTFEKLSSPNYYNYSNDSIYCEYKINVKKFSQFFKGYIKEHKEAWDQFLEDNFKSRSGFISFYPYTAQEWHEKTKGYTSFSDDECPMFVECLNFIAETHEDRELTADSLIEEVREHANSNGACLASDFIPDAIWEETTPKIAA
jgi:hypothetical protein